ncbi:MAG: cytochrome c oxidase subunit II [Paracoccaceae bacterium]
MRFANILSVAVAGVASIVLAGAAWAEDGITGLQTVGQPHLKGIGFQPASTELARDQQWLDGMLMDLCIAVTLLVSVLLLVVIVRFNRRSNPTPARFTHNTPLEIVWTLIPILILVALGSFSLPILFKQQEIPVADVTIKATGNQWYWSYQYPDLGIAFDALRLDGSTKVASLGDNQPMGTPEVHDEIADMKLKAMGYTPDQFLLATDNAVVVPVNKIIVVQVTGADVIHSWTVPAFAVKQDGVPGRTAELWFKAEKEGVYFGQCSELCGKDHAYMPITVKVVSQQAYDDWVARTKQAANGTSAPVQVAASN